MSSPDPLSYLKAIIAKDFEAQRHKGAAQASAEPIVITVSRDYGAGGEEVAEKLADCLGIPVYDQEILDRVAERAKVNSLYFKPHDENVSAGISTFLYSLLAGATADMQTYRRALYDVVLNLAKQNCLLIGRGAHLILRGKRCFRLRIVGSENVCAERAAAELALPLHEAAQRVDEINGKRHKSIQNLFGDSFANASLEYATNFDLVINTDHIAPDGVLPIVLMALRQAGFNLNKPIVTT
jgi:cytidylate kinase